MKQASRSSTGFFVAIGYQKAYGSYQTVPNQYEAFNYATCHAGYTQCYREC